MYKLVGSNNAVLQMCVQFAMRSRVNSAIRIAQRFALNKIVNKAETRGLKMRN